MDEQMHAPGFARLHRIAANVSPRRTMINSQTLDDLAARIGKLFDASPAKDIEKNVKAVLQSGLAKLDVVTRQEFDVQKEVLARTREKLDALEARVATLEASGARERPASAGSG
jgi:BMFP domain-containing protein YqiC